MEHTKTARRTRELKWLFFVFLSLGTGFFLLHHYLLKRSFPLFVRTLSGDLDLTPFIFNIYPHAFSFAIFGALFLLAHFYLRAVVPRADPYILPAVALISGVGLLMMLRLAPDLAILRADALRAIIAGNPSAKVTDNVRLLAQLGTGHIVNMTVGVLAMVITVKLFSPKVLAWMSGRRYVWILLSLILFGLTFFFGTTINGRKLWLFGFQMIEPVKLFVTLFIAGYLYNEGKGIIIHGKGRFLVWCRYTVPYILACLAAVGATVLQQDYGAAMLLFAVCFLMLHLAGNKVYITLLVITIIALTGWTCYTMDFPHVLKQRMDMFLDPFGRGEAIANVLWSISTGGIFGNGIGFGFAHRIPEVQSDFNFAAVCEELGLAGGFALILTYAVLLHRLFRAGHSTRNIYKRMLVTGIGLTIGIQSFIILAGNLNGIPLTGITLPFLSYGGSSLIVSFIMAGIGLRISGDEE